MRREIVEWEAKRRHRVRERAIKDAVGHGSGIGRRMVRDSGEEESHQALGWMLQCYITTAWLCDEGTTNHSNTKVKLKTT
jgi:hypothetical protein